MDMHDVGAQDGLYDAMLRHGEDRWRDALIAAEVLAIGGPDIGGLWLTARAGGIRDRFLDHLRSNTASPLVRLAPGASAASLCGRLDIAKTTTSGRIVWDDGVLAAADGGILVIPMAERLEPGAAAIIAEAMDTRTCPRLRPRPDRSDRPAKACFSVIALDEAAEAEETLPTALSDRLGLHVNLEGISWQTVAGLDPLPMPGPVPDWRAVTIEDQLLEQLFAIAASGGHSSLRMLMHLVRVSRILAAIAERSVVLPEDGLTALRICLGIRLVHGEPEARQEPAPGPPETAGADRDPPTGDSPPPPDAETNAASLDSLAELHAAVERGSIDGFSMAVSERAARKGRSAGKAGAASKNARRGRPYAASRTAPFADARPDLIGTLRAAAPWQLIRMRLQQQPDDRTDWDAAQPVGRARLLIRTDDFRYQRLRHPQPSTAIFVVDASGSTALERLGETKGAIEQLLARCYVRRDEVSLIAFRGKGAEILMEPTRSLVAAKRKLSALPGGGPTPLASGLEKGLELALSVRRRGKTPVVVVMTDGSGNIALDGTADRALAGRQTEQIAKLYRANGLKSICIDIARRPRESVTTLAGLLGADLHLLRQADSALLSRLVNASMENTQP
jgi:magnesium chelatase subunit D